MTRPGGPAHPTPTHPPTPAVPGPAKARQLITLPAQLIAPVTAGALARRTALTTGDVDEPAPPPRLQHQLEQLPPPAVALLRLTTGRSWTDQAARRAVDTALALLRAAS